MSPHIATIRDYPPFVLSAEAEESPGFRSVLWPALEQPDPLAPYTDEDIPF